MAVASVNWNPWNRKGNGISRRWGGTEDGLLGCIWYPVDWIERLPTSLRSEKLQQHHKDCGSFLFIEWILKILLVATRCQFLWFYFNLSLNAGRLYGNNFYFSYISLNLNHNYIKLLPTIVLSSISLKITSLRLTTRVSFLLRRVRHEFLLDRNYTFFINFKFIAKSIRKASDSCFSIQRWISWNGWICRVAVNCLSNRESRIPRESLKYIVTTKKFKKKKTLKTRGELLG